MYPAISIICILMIIGGGVCCLSARRYRTDEHPLGIATLNPRNWKPVWKMQSWFTPKGYWLNLIGVNMLVLASMLGLIFIW